MVTQLSLVDRLQPSGAYLSDRMCPPPAEKVSRVVQFELTTGCSYNNCAYCVMYKDEDFRKKTFAEYRTHVDTVWTAIHRDAPESIDGLQRIFIGGGDALSVDEDTLEQAIQYSISSFRKNVGRLPRRVAVYGGTRNLAKKNYNSLKRLNCGGVCGNCSIDRFGSKLSLSLLYWGLESGSPEVLQHARKGCTADNLFAAIENVRYSGIRLSLMVMPGLGGQRYYDRHVEETVRVINLLGPEFVTFIGLRIDPDTPYAKKFAKEEEKGENRRLTPQEITLQTADMIEKIRSEPTIGVHGDDVHTFGHNPLAMGAVKLKRGFYRDDYMWNYPSTYASAIEIAARLRKSVGKLKKK